MKVLHLVAITLVLTACSSTQEVHAYEPVSLANPASVYCQQLGGITSMAKTADGITGYCALPDGKLFEEWALYRRDHA